MFDIIHEHNIVKQYHEEYLKLIKYYENIKRPASFVKYFNINVDESLYDEDGNITYDIYTQSNVKFDIYEYSPIFFINPIVNTYTNVVDLRGQMMDGVTSIVTYAIDYPRIHDLVTFYDPIQSNEVFRVTGLRTSVNALHSNPDLHYFEMDLEYAPVIDVQSLNINKHYVYNIWEEKFLTFEQYSKLTDTLSKIDNILDDIRYFYNDIYDLYCIDNKYVPIVTNELLILFKKLYNEKFKRIFESYPSPYGYLDIITETLIHNSIEEIENSKIVKNDIQKLYNIQTREIEDYYWYIGINRPSDYIYKSIDSLLVLTYELLALIKEL